MLLRNTPIRRKLLIIFLVVTGGAMLAMVTAFLGFEYANFRHSTLQQLRLLGGIAANNSTAALAFENATDAEEVLGGLKVDPNISAAVLYRADGTPFARYPADVPASALPAAPGPDGYHFESGRLVGFEPVVVGERRLGTLFLQLETRQVIRAWLGRAVPLALGIMTLILAVTYFAANTLQRQISEPILSLAAASRHISESRDYSIRAPRFGEDELGRLTEDFNRMIAQVEGQDREIRQLNAELERRVADRTAQLEASNRELEAFSYSVSHDLRAPLRHIEGFSELLRESAAPRLEENEQRHLNIITNSVRHLGQLIDDLLAFSRMARAELRHSQVDSNTMVRAVVAEHASATEARRIEWKIAPLPPVRADPALLRQVWRNLIANAVKYTGKRAAALIEIGCEEQPGRLVFFVRDNGAGFNMKYAHKLFGVFSRLHGASEFEGTGIGLANVRRIIGRHGGEVWATGEVGQGATFFFSLPLVPPALP